MLQNEEYNTIGALRQAKKDNDRRIKLAVWKLYYGVEYPTTSTDTARQVDISKQTGYTQQHVSQILASLRRKAIKEGAL